ncbi:MAG TPA: 50S ribosomal protein L17 [bacterium]|jgi:large subunit ribosomal protein L17
MRHLNKGRQLNRSASHRKALMENLAQELFQHKRIRTTLAKAKELRPFAEKLVTIAKKNHLAARRHVLEFLTRKSVVKSLFDEIAPTYAERNGGYCRIIKLDRRAGDAAPLAIIELVGYEGAIIAAAEAKHSRKKEADEEKAKPKSQRSTKAKTKKAEEGEAKPKPKAKAKASPAPKKAASKKASKAEGTKAAPKSTRTRKTGEK